MREHDPMTDPTPQPDDATVPGAPSQPVPAEQPTPEPAPVEQPTPEPSPAEQAPAGATRSTWRTVQHATGWCVAVVISLLACLSLAPDLLGFLSDDLRLSLRYPFAQAVALRSGAVVVLVLVGLVVAVSALTRVLRHEGGRRTGVIALVLLLVAGAHTGVLWGRGLDTTDILAASAPDAAEEAWDGNLTVLAFNTYAGRASMVELAIAIRQSTPDVVVLPETHAGDAADLLTLLEQDGLSYRPFVSEDETDSTSASAEASASPTPTVSPTPTSSSTSTGFDGDPGATTVLVSASIGDYEQVTAPDGLGHGAVLLQPVGDAMLNGHQRPTILGVHTVAPLKGTMHAWEESVSQAVAQCASPATGLVLAGDLNATVDHALMQDLGGCSDAALEAGAGGLSTWPTSTRTPLLGAAIDHVLVDTATWTSTGVDLIEITGSDHRALLVTLTQD